MSRTGGYQGKSIAMFNRLDQVTDDWKSLTDLASILEEEFNREYFRARRIVTEWAEVRGESITRAKVGRTVFYISHPNAVPNVNMLAEKYWGELPTYFRRERDFSKLSPDDRLHAVLLAYGFYIHGRKDCKTAFNKFAASHRLWKIQKEL